MPIAEVNGIRLAYEERGSGEPVVLVSGIGMQLVAWPEALLAQLAARGLRVIVLDNRDVGLSTKLDSSGVPASTTSVIMPMRHFVRRIEEPHLLAVDGDSYRTYARSVGRFLPGVGLLS